MIQAGVGHSSNPKTEQAVEEAAGAALAQAGITRADAAFVFFTVEHAADHRQLVEALRRETGTDRIIGSSAAGILTQAGEVEGSQGLAVLVFSSDQIETHPFLFKPLRERDEEVGAEIAGAAAGGGPDSLMALLPDTY